MYAPPGQQWLATALYVMMMARIGDGSVASAIGLDHHTLPLSCEAEKMVNTKNSSLYTDQRPGSSGVLTHQDLRVYITIHRGDDERPLPTDWRGLIDRCAEIQKKTGALVTVHSSNFRPRKWLS